MRAPDPALLELAPSDGGGGKAADGAAQQPDGGGGGDAASSVLDGAGALRLGPLTLATGGMQRRFRLRHRFQLSDKIRASVGAFYSFGDGAIGPTASLTYMLDPRSRIEVNERHALVKKTWVLERGALSLGIGAECRLVHEGLRAGVPPRPPEVSLSLAHIKPLRYEVLGIGLVLLSNLPFSLRDKEVEAASAASRLLGFARATVKRTGYAAFRLQVSELAGVLDVT